MMGKGAESPQWSGLNSCLRIQNPSLQHFQFSSVAQSCPTLCDPHGLQHARPPCPSPTPGACSNSPTPSPALSRPPEGYHTMVTHLRPLHTVGPRPPHPEPVPRDTHTKQLGVPWREAGGGRQPRPEFWVLSGSTAVVSRRPARCPHRLFSPQWRT